MGMFLSKYSMLNALGYGTDRQVLEETKLILDRYKLFGLILHDPDSHSEFHETLRSLFERLDYLTGSDFLFFALTDPPADWIKRNEKRDYFRIWESDKILSLMNAYKTSNESISTYTIAKALNIDFDDLPVIILTNDFQFNQFRAIKTCHRYLDRQMTEIGYFLSRKEKYFSLTNDPDFNEMIKSIDLCGGSFQISNEESLAKTLSDFLAFVIYGDEKADNGDKKLAKSQIIKAVNKVLSKKEFLRDPIRYEQLNLFLFGCLSNLAKPTHNENISLDERCESESKILIRTFNILFPNYEPIKNKLQNLVNSVTDAEAWHQKRYLFHDHDIDYSPLVISLGKIFEIETNLSLVQWFRSKLNIEMPMYYKKYKNDNGDYKVIPPEEIVNNPRPIDLNRGYGAKWIPPGIGESELVARTFLMKGNLPHEISNFKELLKYWAIIRRYRNMAAHMENLEKADFLEVFNAFRGITQSGYLKQFNDLKFRLKQ